MPKDNSAAINNSLKQLQKSMDKLQSLGVLINATYCLPHSGTIYTVGWESLSNIIIKNVNKEDKDFQEHIKTDFADLNAGKTSSAMEVFPIFPTLPPAQSRDDMRPRLLEMIRVSQCKGKNISMLI
jgi:hypothetical protein